MAEYENKRLGLRLSYDEKFWVTTSPQGMLLVLRSKKNDDYRFWVLVPTRFAQGEIVGDVFRDIFFDYFMNDGRFTPLLKEKTCDAPDAQGYYLSFDFTSEQPKHWHVFLLLKENVGYALCGTCLKDEDPGPIFEVAQSLQIQEGD
ncbi:MAG: hypothetical protein HYU64_02945 [Armatimonadetes bacterium]|nr:hypothetical protein [Armatimonadota bacterium]